MLYWDEAWEGGGQYAAVGVRVGRRYAATQIAKRQYAVTGLVVARQYAAIKISRQYNAVET